MASVAVDRGRGAIRSDDAAVSRATEDTLFDILAMAVLVVFFLSIARIGTTVLPTTTNISWAAAYALLAYAIARKADLYLAMSWRNAFMLTAAVIATLSTFWSLTPALSGLRGILLVLNILVGFMLYQQLGLRRVILAVFWFGFVAQTFCAIMLLIGHPMSVDDLGNLRGIYLHKNNLAMHSALLFFTSVILFANGWNRIFSGLGVGLACTNLILSQSGSGLIIFSAMSMILLGLSVAAYGWRSNFIAIAFAMMGFATAITVLIMNEIDVLMLVLDALGKDTTLTGRTFIWDYAFKTISENPMFGIGYFAYWNSPETTAASIWVITSQRLDSFHNIYMDIIVAIGIVGLVPFVISLILVLWRSWCQYLRTQSAYRAWLFAYAAFVTIYGFSEYPIFWNNEFQLLLAFAAAASSDRLSAVFDKKPANAY